MEGGAEKADVSFRIDDAAQENHGDKREKMAICKQFVYIASFQNDHFTVIHSGEKYLKIAEEIGDEDNNLLGICLIVAEAHLTVGQYSVAVSHSDRGLDIAKKTSSEINEMIACLQLSKANYYLHKYNDAIVYGKRCLEIAEKAADISKEYQACTILVNTYQALQQYEDVILYGKKALQIFKETSNTQIEMQICAILGNAHQLLGLNDEVFVYGSRCLEIAEKTGDKEYEIVALVELSNAHNSLKQYSNAIVYCERIQEIAKQIRYKSNQNNSNNNNVDKNEQMSSYNSKLAVCILMNDPSAAIINGLEYLKIAEKTGDKNHQKEACQGLAHAYNNLKQYDDAIVYGQRCLTIAKETDDKVHELNACSELAQAHFFLQHYDDAIVFCKRCLEITKETGNVSKESVASAILINTYINLKQHEDVIIHGRRSLEITKELIPDKGSEMSVCCKLANAYYSQEQYADAIIHMMRYLEIAEEIGNQEKVISACRFLADAHNSLKEYETPIEYDKKCLQIAEKTGDKRKKGSALKHVANVHNSSNQYNAALWYGNRSLEIAKKMGNKDHEISALIELARAYNLLGQHDDAIEYNKKAVDIAEHNHHTNNEMKASLELAKLYYNNKQYEDAIVYGERCLEVSKETGDKEKEIDGYWLLALASSSLQLNDDTIANGKKWLENPNKTHDEIFRELNICLALADAYTRSGKHESAIFYNRRILDIAKEIGNRDFEVLALWRLCRMYIVLKKFDLAFSCLSSAIESSDTTELVLTCESYLLSFFMECLPSMTIDITDTKIRNLSDVEKLVALRTQSWLMESVEQYDSSIECLQQMIEINIGALQDMKNAFCYLEIAKCYQRQNNYQEAIQNSQRALLCAKQSGCLLILFVSLVFQGEMHLKVNDIDNAISFLKEGIVHANTIQDCFATHFLFDPNGIKCFTPEEDKLEHFDSLSRCHKLLAEALIKKGKMEDALLQLEHCRGVLLLEHILNKYGMTHDVVSKSDRLTCSEIQSFFSNRNYSILFYFVGEDSLHRFLIESEKDLEVHSQTIKDCNTVIHTRVKKLFAEMRIHNVRNCENRSLDDLIETSSRRERGDPSEGDDESSAKCPSEGADGSSPKCPSGGVDESSAKCPSEGADGSSPKCPSGGDDESSAKYPSEGVDESSVKYPSAGDDESRMEFESQSLFHILFKDLRMDKLKENLIIIPDGPIFKVPFAALQDPDHNCYMFEKKWIRILPSIRTLMVLENEEATRTDENYDDAFIIGNPKVGKVKLSGKEKDIKSLPHAEKEAEEVAQILGVEALTGHYANKPAVLRKTRQAKPSLIHVAAHGFLEKSAIALAPSYDAKRIRAVPVESDYLLTMQEVQRVKVKTNLAVLGCCHSGCGETPVEGVIGMCRAFLASGARAVVSTLWAIDDEATLEFMKIFYRNLKERNSAGTSLKLTMAEMRKSAKYSDPKYWASFFLMGEDVTIDIPDYPPLA